MENLVAVYNSQLANGIGNLCSRVRMRGEKCRYRHMSETVPQVEPDYSARVESFRFDEALNRIRDEVAAVNREIDHAKPWELLKNGEFLPLSRLLSDWYGRLERIADQLVPFLPECAVRIRAMLHDSPGIAAKPLFPRIKR